MQSERELAAVVLRKVHDRMAVVAIYPSPNN